MNWRKSWGTRGTMLYNNGKTTLKFYSGDTLKHSITFPATMVDRNYGLYDKPKLREALMNSRDLDIEKEVADAIISHPKAAVLMRWFEPGGDTTFGFSPH